MTINTVEKITELIEPLLQTRSIELVDIELKGTIGSKLLKVYVDSGSGITIDECAKLSREISDVFDAENLFSSAYRLEVSSPGADRPLRTERDFLRNKNRKVNVSFIDTEKQRTIEGKIKNAVDGIVEIAIEKDSIEIPINTILKAKLVFQW